MLLKGKPVADKIKEEITAAVEERRTRGENPPKLSLIRVGENPDDIAYENRIIKNCTELGIDSQVAELPLSGSTGDVLKLLDQLNKDDTVSGIMVFRPLPKNFDMDVISKAIKPEKDIDSMSPTNLAKVVAGNKTALAPCTPEAVVEILKHYFDDLTGMNVVVVNRSLVLGKPLAMLLLDENATVTLCHSKTKDIQSLTKKADVVVSGIGRSNFFGQEYFSSGNIVIDVGINFVDGKMVGDVDFDQVEEKVKAITPVPGGVGTVTSMVLLRNVIKGMKLQKA